MAERIALASNPSIDDPAMRAARAPALSLALMDARNHTLHLLAQFEQARTGAEAGRCADANASALWMVGYVGWFQELWIARNPQRALGSACPAQPSRLASIEPRADAAWGAATLPVQRELPSLDTTRAYLLETLETTLELLEQAEDNDDALYFYRLALFHEDLRGERLIALAQRLGVPLKLEPPVASRPREAVLLPATRWQLGSEPGQGFVFDNEQWAHAVEVPEFEIDAQAVTWSQYVEFVADGGYDRDELWLPDGWAWLEAKAREEGRRAPRYVEHIGAAAGAVLQTRFGRGVRMAGNLSATHIGWWEADAWCRWAGRRLPTEVEWEVAAHDAQRRGLRWGDVHEWTATTFRPWPGFAPGPWADYSQPWFGRAKVRRGASFATRARMRHPKLRGFAPLERDAQFVGFRSCAA